MFLYLILALLTKLKLEFYQKNFYKYLFVIKIF